MRKHHSGTTTKNQDGVCLTTVRRLRKESAKKEELAVQQPRRTVPPFLDVSPPPLRLPPRTGCRGRRYPILPLATVNFRRQGP